MKDCNVIVAYVTQNSKVVKRLEGFFFQGEFTRAVVLPGNVSGWENYNAPMGYGYHQFSTLFKSISGILCCFILFVGLFTLIYYVSYFIDNPTRSSETSRKSAVSKFAVQSSSSSQGSTPRYILTPWDSSKTYHLICLIMLTVKFIFILSSHIRWHFNNIW